jgi:hypothetical protein
MSITLPCIITDARQAINNLMVCLQIENVQTAANEWNMYQSHVHKLANRDIPTLQTMEKIRDSEIARGACLQIVVGEGDSDPVRFNPENCLEAYRKAFTDYKHLSKQSGIAYVTAYEITTKRKPKTRLDTILKFAKACHVRFIL